MFNLSSTYSEKIQKKKYLILIFITFFVYLALRGLEWKYTLLLEDTDSLSYLDKIKVFATFNVHNIINLDADATPFYPFWGALFSLPGWSVETGARLCSLFFSSLLFIALVGIGKKIAEHREAVLGLLIVSFSPVLISLSPSVLTEPSYIATIYLGLWFYWTQYKNPKLWKAGLLGLIFGLAFLNRVEGILYIAIIPFVQGVYTLLESRKKNHNLEQLAAWSLIFVICFSLMAIPQIWRVSHKMGIFAINGRQVWSRLLSIPDGKSEDEKIFGLDFSDSRINIKYLKDHPEELNRLKKGTFFTNYVKTFVRNFDDLYQRKLGLLIGPIGLILFAFGMLSRYEAGQGYETFLVISFIALNLVAPLSMNVVIRHIAVIAPIMMLMEGIGIVYLSDKLLEVHKEGYRFKQIVPIILFIILIAVSAKPLIDTFRPRHYNREYSLTELKEPISIVKQISKHEQLALPVIVAQRGYLAYYSNGEKLYVPYTNYDGLVKYCELNKADFLYLKYKRIKKYPFYEAFLKNRHPTNFKLLYNGIDATGGKIELYRYLKKQS